MAEYRNKELGSFMNILDYEFNYTSFWLLDILSKLIKHMQLRGFSVINQNISLTWFRFVLRSISVSGDSREEIFCLLQEMFLKAEETIKSGDSIPQPEEINIEERSSTKLAAVDDGSQLSSKSLQSVSSRQSRKKLSQRSSKSLRKSSLISRISKRSRSSKSLTSNPKITSEEKVELNLQTLYSIIEIIYKVFADRFIFSLISQTYSSPTIVAPVEIPIDFKDPKLLRPIIVVTPPMSPSTRKTSASKSGKKGKGEKKTKRKGSPSSKEGEDKANDENTNIKSKKGKSNEKGGDKGGKGKKKSKPSLSDHKEEAPESKIQPKGKGGKTKKKSKSSEDTKIIPENKDNADTQNTTTTINNKCNSLDELQNTQVLIEEKLKLFDKAVAPEMKLEMKKIEVKDKFILPLSEGVRKDYVENLIKSLLPLETKPTDNTNDSKRKSEGKSRKSSSLKEKKKKNSKSDKKSKGKKSKS